MPESHVLIEASSAYANTASVLLAAAQFKPVFTMGKQGRAPNVLHQIKTKLPAQKKATRLDRFIRLVQAEVEETQSLYEGQRVVFCMPQVADDAFGRVVVELGKLCDFSGPLELAYTIQDAVARIVLPSKHVGKVTPPPPATFLTDAVPGMDAATHDLRDDSSGKLNAKKVSELFGVTVADLAESAEISRQGLDQTPTSEKAQPVLRQFERIARLRTHPQFRDPSDLRKWFRKPLPLFSNHSAEELFKRGKLDVVATRVDQMLTGDFGG
jgi:hypothetical protein